MQSFDGPVVLVEDGVAMVGLARETLTSQDPQVPSPQEDSTEMPASSTTDRIDRSGGTVRVRSLWARCISKASVGAPVRRRVWRAKRSTCSDFAGQARQFCSTAASRGSGPQQ